ncbi:MAG: hypothetical protein KAU46_11665 [Candidatus Aminicenantes bacterium]|nr:hypothetical protein [Candidatus Aminicenantes bacterium]
MKNTTKTTPAILKSQKYKQTGEPKLEKDGQDRKKKGKRGQDRKKGTGNFFGKK